MALILALNSVLGLLTRCSYPFRDGCQAFLLFALQQPIQLDTLLVHHKPRESSRVGRRQLPHSGRMARAMMKNPHRR